MVDEVSTSTPFEAMSTCGVPCPALVWPSSALARDDNISRMAWLGMATMTRSAPSTTAERSVSARSRSGSVTSTR